MIGDITKVSIDGAPSMDRLEAAFDSPPTGRNEPAAEVGTMDEATRQAARVFLRRLDHEHLTIDALVFGSRARGTHQPDSDADLAVILSGPRGDRYKVSGAMAEVAFDVMLETGVMIDPLPLWEDELSRPDLFGNPALIAIIKRDGRRPWSGRTSQVPTSLSRSVTNR